MQGPFAALWRMTHAEVPLALVLYRDPRARDEWSGELRVLLESRGATSQTTTDVERALTDLDVPLLLVPEPEEQAEAVRRLSVGRDGLIRRTATAVLFLLLGGSGQVRLQAEAALASFLAGVTLDPDASAEVDIEEESRWFLDQTGRSPADFIEASDGQELPDTLENSVHRLRALLLTAGS